MSLHVLAHLDPFVLEHELIEQVRRAQRRTSEVGVLVLVPTARLRDHIQRRLAEECGALLGVWVEHYRSLCFKALEGAEATARVLSPTLRRSLVEQALRRMPHGPLTDFARRRPGTLPVLGGCLNDLREAGISHHAAVRELGRSEHERWIAQLYDGYQHALDAGARQGLYDEAGLVGRALGHLQGFVERAGIRAVFHHGAYELIGVHLDLLRELERHRQVTFLLPAEPGTPVSRYAERFARRFLIGEREELVRLPDRQGGLLGSRLCRLFDEQATTTALPEGRLMLRNSQGADGEVTWALRSALRATRDGTHPERVAIVARSLEPYLARCESVAADTEMPCSIGGHAALRRHPVVHDLLLLLRAVIDDFPRAATVELLRSPRIRWFALGVEPPASELAEIWSRRARLLGGREAWAEDLPRWAGEQPLPGGEGDAEQDARRRRLRRAEGIGRAVEALAASGHHAPARWSEHAAWLEACVRKWLPGYDADPPDVFIESLLLLLDQMRLLDDLRQDREPIALEGLVAWLEGAVDACQVPLQQDDRGGIRIIDVMQARGLTFDRVLLLGMNEKTFPRPPREDPFLADDARRRLRDSTGRPLTVAQEADDEERLLLALMLGGAKQGLEVSWQRADDAGQARSPSLALREVARVGLGRADLDGLLRQAHRLPAHPALWIEELEGVLGSVSPDEERVLMALRSSSPAEVRAALGQADDGLVRGLRMLDATEDFAAKIMDYDGRVESDRVRREVFGVTALEDLAACPLRYFFKHALRVRPLDDEASALELDQREQGLFVHELLEQLYLKLRERDVFSAANSARQKLVRRLLDETWEAVMGPLAARMGKRLPLLWRHYADRARDALERFVLEDVERVARSGSSVEQLESLVERSLALGDGLALTVRGRLDRKLRGPDGLIVGDYKTGKIEDKVNVTRMLKGETLQVPLYHLLEQGSVELLGVGLQHDPDEIAQPERIVRFDGFENPRHLAGFLETLSVLLSLLQRGAFPLNRSHCKWCDYVQACRRTHPPTLEREAAAGDSADYRALGKKNMSAKPLLDDVHKSVAENR